MKRITQLIPILILGLLLVACGGDTPASVEEPDVESKAEEPAEEADEEASGPTGDCEAGFRFFDHELLASDPVCIPENPQRIAVQDLAAMELMYMLDIKPTAVALDWVYAVFPTLPAPYGSTITDFFTEAINFGGFELNLEVLLEAEPDIILINMFYGPDEDTLAAMSEIAPVVAVDSIFWKDITPLFGDALGIEAEANGLVEAYEARIAALNEAADGQLAGSEAALVMIGDDGSVSANLPGGISWVTLEDVGFIPPSGLPQTAEATFEQFQGNPYPPISTEELSLIDGEFIIVMNGGYDDEGRAIAAEQIDDAVNGPLWGSLSAVQNDQVYRTGGFWLANGVIEAHIVIDELITFFTDLSVEDVAPNPVNQKIGE